MSSDYCIVCADPLEFCAFGACGHKETCSKCVVRLRTVLKNTKCVVCQQPQPKVFVTRFAGDYTRSLSKADFDQLERSTPKNCCLKESQAYFDDARHCEELQGLCSFTHPLAGSFSSLKALKQELKRRHNAEFCSICLEGRKVFISEQVVYNKQQLQRHMKQGDDDGPMARAVGFKGHPLCHFCNTRYYGDNEQFEHMTRVHEECFICKRRSPHKHVYYENYGALEEHFKEEHHICQNQECLEKKFVVFSTDQELKTHVVREHGGSMTKAEKKQALTVETGFLASDRRGAAGGASHSNSRALGSSSSMGRGGGGSGVTISRPANYLSQDRRQDVIIIGGDANMPSRNSSRNASTTNLPAELEDRMARAEISERRGAFGNPNASQSTGSLRSLSTQSRSSSAANLASEAEFPSIAASTGRPAMGGRWAATNAPHHQKNLSGNAAEDFPALGGGSKPSSSRPPKTMASMVGRQGQARVIHTSNEAFPALTPMAAPERDLSSAPMSSSLRRANEALARKMKKRLGASAYQEFKETNTSWAAGKIPTVEYHELVVSLGIANLVPEIAATCTNPKAREELLDAHAAFKFSDTASPGSAREWVPPEVAALSRSTLSSGGGVWNCSVCTLLNSELNKTCEVCGSLRTRDDRLNAKNIEAFPSLGDASSSASAKVPGQSGAGKKGKAKKVGLNDFYSTSTRPHPQNVWKNPNLKKH